MPKKLRDVTAKERRTVENLHQRTRNLPEEEKILWLVFYASAREEGEDYTVAAEVADKALADEKIRPLAAQFK